MYRSIVPEFDIDIYSRSLINACWYTIDDEVLNYTFSGFTGTINRIAWEKKNYGSITLRFYAKDYLGYLGFNEVKIIKEPPAVSGFNIFLLILTISFISVYIIRKIKYKLSV